MNEHDPIFAEVYAVPKVAAAGQRPVRSNFPAGGSSSSQNPAAAVGFNQKAGSPRLLGDQPSSKEGTPRRSPRPDGVVSQVQAAALAETSPSSRGRSPRAEQPMPLYEVRFHIIMTYATL